MKIKPRAVKVLPAVAVFVLVGTGVYAALPDDDNADRTALVPVVVVTRGLPEGAPAATVRQGATVRMVPRDARAEGAVTSLSALPDGVLAHPLVRGQQVLVTSLAADHVRSLGPGYVAVSVKLDTQRWAGPVIQSGRRVEVWDTTEAGPKMVAPDAVVLDAPSPAEMDPEEDTVVSLGVKRESVGAVLLAAANERVWLVSR